MGVLQALLIGAMEGDIGEDTEIKVLFSCSVQWANDSKDKHDHRWHQEWIPEMTVGNVHGGWKS